MDLVYTQNKSYYCPEYHAAERNPEHEYVPLRGYGYILGVILNNVMIGWINVTLLGYPTVKAWIKATNWTDNGY